MQQIKIFIDTEARVEDLEETVNSWLKESGARVVNMFGNIAPQTTTLDSKGQSLGRNYASSDLFLVVVYEANG